MSDSGITEASFDLFAVHSGMLDHSTFIDDDSKGKTKYGIQGQSYESGFRKHTMDGMAF